MPAPRTAIEIVHAVGSGELSPVNVAREHLERIAALDQRVGAFEAVRSREVLAEADALAARSDLAGLPLAGVPVAVKDNLPIAGEVPGHGHPAARSVPAEKDHEVVGRLRAAGALIVGRTRMPQLAIWGTSDCPCGIARNPWDLRRSAGGSSGGSAAAVVAGMVPVAVGNDGMGSVRVPAASCGAFGIKPGRGLVPSKLSPSSWMGMAENGAIATTVADTALLLSVMAGTPDLATVVPECASLRIAVSTKSPLIGVRVGGHHKEVATAVADLLRRLGHSVRAFDPPYSVATASAVVAWWTAGVAEAATDVPRDMLERRARGHVAVGRLVRRRGWAKPKQRDDWRRRSEEYFADIDVLLTPALASPPPSAGPWCRRSWPANLVSNAYFAPFAAPWNFAGYPAAAVPAGMDPRGTPIAVQLVAPVGAEATILRLAAQIEKARPWTRLAPL